MFDRFRPYAPTAAFMVLFCYFTLHAFTGERGILNEPARERGLAARMRTLAELRAERQELEARVRLLSDSNLSRDLLEERARVLLGLAGPRDYVVRLNG